MSLLSPEVGDGAALRALDGAAKLAGAALFAAAVEGTHGVRGVQVQAARWGVGQVFLKPFVSTVSIFHKVCT